MAQRLYSYLMPKILAKIEWVIPNWKPNAVEVG